MQLSHATRPAPTDPEGRPQGGLRSLRGADERRARWPRVPGTARDRGGVAL